MIKYLFLTLSFLFFSKAAFACSMLAPQTSGFDANRYIFISEVVEVIKNVNYEFLESKGEAIGFKVKVSENIYSPKQATYYEVFPLRLSPDCDLRSDKEKLLKQFPIGSQVRVVAKEPISSKNQLIDNSTIRLETSIYNNGSFTRNDLSENLQTSAKVIYDYRNFVEKQRTSAAEDVIFDSNYYLPEFEMQKDLLRLKKSKSEEERIRILERLLFYPHIYSLNYQKIAKDYIKNREKVAVLEKQWKQRVQEFYKKRQ